MSENIHKGWAPGLVALHTIGDHDLALRTEKDAREYVAYQGRWRTEAADVGWAAVAGVWGESVWTGSRGAFQRMRDDSKSPADLLRMAREDAQSPGVDSTVVIFGEKYVKASDIQAALAQAEATIETLRRDLEDAEESASTWCDRFNNEREQMDRIRAALGERFSGESTAGMVAEIEILREEIKTHKRAAADAQMRRDDSVQCYAAEADSARAEAARLRAENDCLRAEIEACKRAPRVARCLADIEPGIYVSANGDVWKSERSATIRFNVGDTECYLWTASDDHDPVRANAPFIRIC